MMQSTEIVTAFARVQAPILNKRQQSAREPSKVRKIQSVWIMGVYVWLSNDNRAWCLSTVVGAKSLGAKE